MNSQPFNILAINETKLDSTITDEQMRQTEYNIIRNDRDVLAGWGASVILFAAPQTTK